MIKKFTVIYLLLASTLLMAQSGWLRYESLEVEITAIDLQNNSLNFIHDKIKKSLKMDEQVLLDGYYLDDTNTKKLSDLELNKKYFIRIAIDDYTDSKGQNKSDSYVSFIGTVDYDDLY